MPNQDAITRYGEKRAEMFEQISDAKTDLMNAFDLLLEDTENVVLAGARVDSFRFMWNLLDERHQAVLNMEKE